MLLRLLLLLLTICAGYSPENCTVTNYDFTFLNDGTFKVHGIWPEQCAECLSCSYPTCCNTRDIKYVYPDDPGDFIGKYWYNTTTTEQCTGLPDVILFRHEYYKHISCTNIGSTDDFLQLTIKLYNLYYDRYVSNNCNGSSQLYLNLDSNFNYIKTRCLDELKH